jgi:hypothetical protein
VGDELLDYWLLIPYNDIITKLNNQPSKGKREMTTIKTTAQKFFDNLDSGKWQIVYTIEVCEKYEVLNTRNGKHYIVVL